jgi:hypothetical protein
VFVTINETGTAVVPVTETAVAGVKAQVVPAGRSAQDKVTVPVYPVVPTRVTVVLALPPELNVTVVGVGGVAGKARLKSGAMTADAKAVTKLATFAEPRPPARLKLFEALYPSEPARGPV